MIEYFRCFEFNQPALEVDIREVETKLNFFLPEEYHIFLRRGNGGDGFIGENYVILWKVEELIELNDSYEVSEYAPGLFLFGSNGGGEAFAFDLRNPHISMVKLPFIGMDLQEVVKLGESFIEFLDHLYREE